MIGYLEGKILKKEEDRVLVLANQIGYEVLLPAIVMKSLQNTNIGAEISLYIFFQQTERQPKPVLIGFNRASLSRALERAESRPARLERTMASVMNSIPAGSSLRQRRS